MSVIGVTRRGFAMGGSAAAAALCAADVAGDGLVEGLVASDGFRGHRAYPLSGLKHAPILLFAPVSRGRAAPLHHAFAARLARRGFYVATPELTVGRAALFGALAFAAAEGARVSIRCVLGYEAGARVAHEALARDPGLMAGVAVGGPLGGNPIAAGLAGCSAYDRRMLTLDGREGLRDAASAERLVDEVVRRLVRSGIPAI